MSGSRIFPLALACALVTTTACGSGVSRLSPTTVRPGELVWRYDGELLVEKGGRPVASEELAGAVACVPRAARDAERSDSLAGSGDAWSWVGLTTLLVGVVGGGALAIAGATGNDDGMLIGGLAAVGGGLVLGTTFGLVGSSQISESVALQLDAVNRYNDAVYQSACGSPRVAAVEP